MNKRLLLPVFIAIIIALIGAGVYAFTRSDDQDKADQSSSASSSNEPEKGEFSGEPGRPILLSRFSVAFSLPERFDVTDIKVIYKVTDKYETAAIASKTLPSKLNKDKCWGGTLSMGSFAEITRYKDPDDKQDLKHVGNYYYRVDEGPAASVCYDAETYDNYYNEDVVEAIRSTLSPR